MKKNLLLVVGLVLLFVWGCVSDPTAYSPESDFTVDKAKQFFESNAEDLRQVGFSPEALSRAATGNLIPEWKSAKTIRQGDITTIEVPIAGELSRVARILQLSSTKKPYAYVSGVTTRLIIQHHKQSGSERQFLVTMIDNSQQAFKKVKAPDYSSRSDYSGYIIISSVAGEYLDSYRSDDGKWTRVFMAPGTAEDLDDPQNVGLSLMGAEASPAAYVLGETGGGDGSGSLCSKCGTYGCVCCRYCNGNGCSSCMVVVYPTCSRCGFSGPNAHLGQCRCCPSCKLYPCRCTSACVVCQRNPCICSAYSCSYCGSKYCNGACQGGGGTVTPPTPSKPCTDQKCSMCGGCILPTLANCSRCACANSCDHILCRGCTKPINYTGSKSTRAISYNCNTNHDYCTCDWWTGDHETITQLALWSKLTKSQLYLIHCGQKEVDNEQGVEQSPWHAMRAPDQTREQAIQEMRTFFCREILTFRNHNDLVGFGWAIHPIQDAYSPAHNFNIWTGSNVLPHIFEWIVLNPRDTKAAVRATERIFNEVMVLTPPISDAQAQAIFDRWLTTYEQYGY